ncbi:MAG: hypothetical protein L0H23_06170 [Luteimonas sp.]|nr:hypothetical protein [Luteimonas sp.]
MNGQPPDDARRDPVAPRAPSLIRRCALGIWLCGIALMGVVEFRRHALVDDVLAMTPVAWMWLVGSTVTGVVGIVLLLRELRRRRSAR